MITDRDGVDWLTAGEAAEQVHGRLAGARGAALLRQWKRRGYLRSAVVGGKAHYPRAELVEAEWLTRTRTPGMPLDADDLGVAS